MFSVELDNPELNIREIELLNDVTNRHGLHSFQKIIMQGWGRMRGTTNQIIDDGPFYQRYFSEVTLKTGQTKRTQRGI